MARKQKHEEHENLERWLVSYADFITLMFALFVVLYALSSINTSKYKALAESIRASFTFEPTPANLPKPQSTSMGVAPVQIVAQKPDLAAAEEMHRQRETMKEIASSVQEALQSLAKEGKVKVTELAQGISIEINASILFDTAKADLHKESIEALSAVAKVLAPYDHQVQIEGHTDNLPIRSAVFPSNWELSAARAGSVIRLFESNGVAGSRMVAVGYADKRPIAPNETEADRAHNRRVNIMVLAPGKSSKGAQGTGLSPDVRAAAIPQGLKTAP